MSKVVLFLIAFLACSYFANSQNKIVKKSKRLNQPNTDSYWIDGESTLLKEFPLDNSANRYGVRIDIATQKIIFYKYINGKRVQIGKDSITLHNVGSVMLEDLNGDGVKEVLVCTSPNMNGNQWILAYVYNKQIDRIQLAGNFCTNYTVNVKVKTIEVYYTGSWYMDVYKEIYKWYGCRLVPEKKVVLSIIDQEKSPDSLFILYYKNPTPGNGKLKLVSKEVYNEKNPAQLGMWDAFFDSEVTNKRNHK